MEKYTIRLEIDRFFDECRTELGLKYSFQNEDPTHIELLRECGVEYVYTSHPKRSYVLDATKLFDCGAKIYFKVSNDECYEELKETLFRHFSNKLFISPKVKKKPDYVSGYFELTNLRK